MSHERVMEHVGQSGIIAILRRLPETSYIPVAHALVEGGVRAIEITLDAPSGLKMIAQLRDTFGDRVAIGAGTILTPTQLREAVAAGAQYLLSPHFDASLVCLSLELGHAMIPGVQTPTEVMAAKNAGATMLKLFPAGSLGSGYLKDLLGPFHGTSFIPTGGIHAGNAADYIRAGAFAVGMGSSLVSRELVENQDWDALTERVREVTAVVETARRT